MQKVNLQIYGGPVETHVYGMDVPFIPVVGDTIILARFRNWKKLKKVKPANILQLEVDEFTFIVTRRDINLEIIRKPLQPAKERSVWDHYQPVTIHLCLCDEVTGKIETADWAEEVVEAIGHSLGIMGYHMMYQ